MSLSKLSQLRYPIAFSFKRFHFSTSAVLKNVGDLVPTTVRSVGVRAGSLRNSNMLQKYMLEDKVVVITG